MIMSSLFSISAFGCTIVGENTLILKLGGPVL